MFTRKTIIQKTIQVGGSTLVSRFLGVIRDVLTVHFLGATALSDAFFTAWKVPNLFRKIFAEGALSAAFVPTIVQVVKKRGRQGVSSMMSLGFLVFESMVLLLCAAVIYFAHPFIALIAPGFSAEQIENGVVFLRILMPFIFFISTNALIAGPLQAVGHFFIPAFGPVLLNIVYIIGLIVCMFFSLPVTILCWFILLGGFIQLIAYVSTFWYLDFRFGAIGRTDIIAFGSILAKFGLCLISMSVMEVGLFVDTSFGSYLSKGSITLISYASRFMGIPLGVFAVAFSTILLPHFSRISSYAPKRLGFYLLEATKLVWWVTIPIALSMMLLSQQIFSTLFLSDQFTLQNVHEAASILNAFLAGLFFFAINKILSNVYYSLHHTFIPGVIAMIAVFFNIFLDWMLLDAWGAVGLAIATSAAGILQAILLFMVLYHHFNLPFYFQNFLHFIIRYAIQIILVGVPFIALYYGIKLLVSSHFPSLAYLFFQTVVLWVWIAPLLALFIGLLYYTRALFGVRLLFFETE